MARSTDAEVTIGANIAALRKELGKIEGITAGEAKRMTIALEREFQAQKKAARSAAKATRAANSRAARQAAREWKEKLGDIEQASNTVFGEMVGDTLDVGRGLGALGPAGVVVAGLTAEIVALGALSAASFGLVFQATVKSEEALKRLEELDLKPPIDEEALASVQALNDALEGLSVPLDMVYVAIGQEVGPELEALGRVTLGAALMAADAYKAYATFAGGLQSAVGTAVNFARESIDEFRRDMVAGAVTAVDTAVQMHEAFGIPNPSLKTLQSGLHALQETTMVQQGTVAGWDSILTSVGIDFGNYGERVDEIITKVRAHKDAEGERSDELDVAADKAKQLEEQHRKNVDLFNSLIEQAKSDEIAAFAQEQIDLLDQLGRREEQAAASLVDRQQAKIAALRVEAQQYQEIASNIEYAESVREQAAATALAVQQQLSAEVEAIHQADMQRMVEGATATTESMVGSFGALGSAISGVVDNVVGDSEKMTEGQRTAARVAFGIQQGAALAEVGVNTAQGVSKIIGMYPPGTPLWPLGLAATGLTVAAGAAQGAAIATSTPQFPLGGIVPQDLPPMTGSTDHGLIAASGGEAVLNRRATEALGESGVARLNRLEGMGGSMVIEQVYKHKVYDRFVADNIAKGGPLRSAIDRPKRTGHSRRRR